MKEVRGRTLAELIASDRAQDGRRLRRFVGWLHQVCESVAYAHARGVVHRDLKPSNVMVGGFGEVLVLDWGLARLSGVPADTEDRVRTDRSPNATRMGAVVGTPMYMAPEQALSRLDDIGPHSDTFALGCMLLELLTGAPPRPDGDLQAVLAAARSGPPTVPDDLPEPLRAVCVRATAQDPADRYADASPMADAVARWLDGDARRERARSLFHEATGRLPGAHALSERSREVRADADALLAGLPPHTPFEAKTAAWQQQDEAEQRARAATVETGRVEGLVRAALAQDPELSEAHRLLAERHQAAQARAEAARDAVAAGPRGGALRAGGYPPGTTLPSPSPRRTTWATTATCPPAGPSPVATRPRPWRCPARATGWTAS